MHVDTTRLALTPPSPFDYEATAQSHGWVELAPNGWDKEQHAVQRVERLSSGQVVFLRITGAGSIDRPEMAIEIRHAGELPPKVQDELITAVGRMFRLDEDLSAFYAMCKERGEPWAKLTTGLGRVLRSPMLFEDVVKTICTINIQWGGTKGMVRRLVSAFGAPYPGDPALRAFPTAEAVAAASPEAFAEAVRMGFRTPYVHTLAQRVASGELDLEALRDPGFSTPELRKKLMGIKGVGPYAAAPLLMLLGRYDELAVDTAFREFVSRKYFAGHQPGDKEAQAIYADWGPWKYLAFWFDIWQGYADQRG
jgi:3-methyladenine DNA glycosylase/8-oxoguanine DNA glycosylase